MKIAILGGSRLIGASLVPSLMKKFAGAELHLINRGVTPPPIDYDSVWPQKVFRHIADRSSPLEFNASLEKIAGLNFDAVIDCSCYAKDELTPAIRAFSKKITHYVFISTASVYGTLKYAPATELHPLDNSENNSMYGREKIKCEKELLYSAKNGDFAVTIIRPTYIYGPFDYTNRLFYFIDRIYKKIPIFIPSGGQDSLYNSVYVKDLADQIAGLSMNPSAYNQIYNSASRDSVNFSSYLNLLGTALEREVKIVYISAEEYKKASGGLVFPYSWYHAAYDCAKMKELFGEDSFPATDYLSGFVETIKWHKSHGDLPSSSDYLSEVAYYSQNFKKSGKMS